MTGETRMLKYDMPEPGEVKKVDMPAGWTPSLVGMQRDGIRLWARVPSGVRGIQRVTFVTVGTGHPVAASARLIGTTQDGGFVWHVFQLDPEAP